jgi:hypothetical protein
VFVIELLRTRRRGETATRTDGGIDYSPRRMGNDFLPAIANDRDDIRRTARLREATYRSGAQEFAKRLEGMIHAMDGGLWLHRHVWRGRPMVHLVSTDRVRLLVYGDAIGIPAERLQYKPLRDPRTRERREAWHWDLGGPVLPPHDPRLFTRRAAG